MSAFMMTMTGAHSSVYRDGFRKNNNFIQQAADSTKEPYTTIERAQDVDILWTRSTFVDAFSTGSGGAEDCMSQRWEWYWPPTGCHVRKTITGVVRDANGTPVAGATVRLFNTATGLLVDTQTTAGDGTYTTSDPNAVACIEIGYLTGSPDRAGVTVNTLTGT